MAQLSMLPPDCEKAYSQGWREACEAARNLAISHNRALRSAQYRAACSYLASEIGLLGERQPARRSGEVDVLGGLLLEYADLLAESVSVSLGIATADHPSSPSEALKGIVDASQALAAKCDVAFAALSVSAHHSKL